MIGNRVRLITSDNTIIEGELRKLDAVGAVIYRTDVVPEQRENLFTPAHRIYGIRDLGRMPCPAGDLIERFSSSNIMWSLDGARLQHELDGQWVRYKDHAARVEELTNELNSIRKQS